MQTPTDAEMQAVMASDPLLKALEGKAAEHQASEVERIAALQEKISATWAELRELKTQRGLLKRAIANQTTALRAMIRRSKIRKPHTLNRRIATRKMILRRREETRLGRAVSRQAIIEFRKRVGISPAGVSPQ